MKGLEVSKKVSEGASCRSGLAKSPIVLQNFSPDNSKSSGAEAKSQLSEGHLPFLFYDNDDEEENNDDDDDDYF